MKKLSTMLAVAALVGAASAYAANPFSDVPTDSWAYQAVSQLASEGVVVGYPNGTFGGEKNITRYEMAQIVARALAVEDRANAEQRAVINKLAQEFGAELVSLGVKVSDLENKIGNVKLSGDARLRFKHSNESTGVYLSNVNGQIIKIDEKVINNAIDDEKFASELLAPGTSNFRDALNKWINVTEDGGDLGKDTINNASSDKQAALKEARENVLKTIDIVEGLYDLATENNSEKAKIVDKKINEASKSESWDYRVRLNANAKVNEKTSVGARFVLASEFGKASSTNVEFDRLFVNHKFGSVNATAGRFGLTIGDGLTYDSTVDGAALSTDFGAANFTLGYVYPVALGNMKDKNQTLTLAQVSGDVLEGVNVKAYYAKAVHLPHKKIFGAAASGMVGPVKVNAEYAKSDLKKSNALVLGTSYSYGPATLGLQYFYENVNAPVLDSTYDVRYNQNWKGFVASLDYAVSENTTAQFVYSFKGNLVEKRVGDVVPAAKYYAQLVYKF